MTPAATPSEPDRPRRCTVPGCDRTRLARGYCRPHYVRWQRHRDPQAEVPVRARARVATDYPAALRRVRALRGPADARRCADCGEAATLWCYDGSDPAERRDAVRGHPYSLDPGRYRPRCRSCHLRSRARGRPIDVDRAARLYRGGASAHGIGAVLGVSGHTVLRALRTHGIPIRPSGRNRSAHHS